MNTPKVSVIVPALNTLPYLAECLDSLVAQTLPDIEVICVDNGSDDGSYEMLQEYARGDIRITVIQHVGGRQGGARNAGLAVARGRYVGFVDSDDSVDPQMFGKLYQLAHSTEAEVVVCNLGIRQQRDMATIPAVPSDRLSSQGSITIHDSPKLLRNLTICNRLFSAGFLERTGIRFPEGVFHEDQYFVVAGLLSAHAIATTPEALYFYRKGREGSVSQHQGADNQHVFDVMAMLTRWADSRNLPATCSDLLRELKVCKCLELFHTSRGTHRREFYMRMKEEFLEITLTETPRLLTPTERREFRVVRTGGWLTYRAFLAVRTIYGTTRWKLCGEVMKPQSASKHATAGTAS